ncbi:hypothetical protein GUJ93_ZPchr0014g47310 [Zizania palustris]|uniref:Uncharacterized protein n=1 Tax=Zizania palustris TaxID=103762 RepID=A0A8J5TEI1_ZIZPA|nr:hypothetical protein GUJ93_ZPchr0014g47310 [Zizania palustris]
MLLPPRWRRPPARLLGLLELRPSPLKTTLPVALRRGLSAATAGRGGSWEGVGAVGMAALWSGWARTSALVRASPAHRAGLAEEREAVRRLRLRWLGSPAE